MKSGALWKSKHLNTVVPCQKYREGNCSFSKEMCWWRHEDQNGWKEDGRIKCFICNDAFESKDRLMVHTHRKKNHLQTVRECTNFKRQTCRFQSELCWFKHELETADSKESEDGVEEEEDSEEESNVQTIFREAPRLKNPLTRTQQKK